jgi:hypothetical protein
MPPGPCAGRSFLALPVSICRIAIVSACQPDYNCEETQDLLSNCQGQAMSRTFAALTLALISVGPIRAADTYDSLAEEAVKLLDHLAACLASIKDPASGEQARVKLAGCTRSFADLKNAPKSWATRRRRRRTNLTENTGRVWTRRPRRSGLRWTASLSSTAAACCSKTSASSSARAPPRRSDGNAGPGHWRHRACRAPAPAAVIGAR